jgi:glutamate--cysteine ligase
MNWKFYDILQFFSKSGKYKYLSEGNFGIEKESQRVTVLGDLALTSHPAVFGDKSKNERITTDFSESQIEMITPPLKSVEEVYNSLNEIQQEVQKGIQGELLWPMSMPPRLPEEKDIPIARFPESEESRDIETYRNGLALRYGKKMQMISGIHYNFSFSEDMIDSLYEHFGKEKERQDFMNEIYFSLTRNFLRYRWLLIYLFGASPFCDSTYDSVIYKELESIQACCPDCCDMLNLYNRYATSLRVSRFGYSNTRKSKYTVYYDSLEEYIHKLHKMLQTVDLKYKDLGINKDGTKLQLNSNILQKESEFYSPIRVKQNISKGETQLNALEKRGVKYIEVRILDINPLEMLGMSLNQLYFMQVFMIFCLFESNHFITERELEKINTNHHLVALFGRKEDLMLHTNGNKKISLKQYGNQIFDKLRAIAELMDHGICDNRYLSSVMIEYRKIDDISLLLSERIAREMKENNLNFIDFGIKYAINHSKIKGEESMNVARRI